MLEQLVTGLLLAGVTADGALMTILKLKEPFMKRTNRTKLLMVPAKVLIRIMKKSIITFRLQIHRL